MSSTQLLRDLRLGWALGWLDVSNSYKRSKLGPFWTTLNTGVLILCLGMVFGSISRNSSSSYFAYIAFGVVFWSFISATLVSAGGIFSGNEQAIRQTNLNFWVYYLRHIIRSTLNLAHSIILFPIVVVTLGFQLNATSFMAVPGFILVTVFLWSACVVLAYLSTRFRDFSPMITSAVTVLFYLTPVVWLPEQVHEGVRGILVDFNPLAQMLELLRAPLIGELPTLHSVVFSLASTTLVSALALVIGRKYRNRVAYWL